MPQRLIVHGSVSYTHLDVYKRQEYYFVVTALNSDGQSAASSPVVNATPTTVPSAPLSPSLLRSGKNITVSWGAPATGGLPITAYDVYESTTPTVSTSGAPKAAVSGSTLSATIKKLSKTAKYYFVVLAVNTDGKSAPSATITTQDKTKTTVRLSLIHISLNPPPFTST